MGFSHPYEEVDWSGDETHLTQLHTHEPRNMVRAESSDHDPAVDTERIPLDDLGKNSLSPAPDPSVLARKYRNAGYTVFALTEHEYYVDGEKYKTAAYDEFPERLSQTSWAWEERGSVPPELEMVALSGTELRATVAGTLHDVIGLDTEIGHGQGRSLTTLLDALAEEGGLAVLPHPSKYFDPEEYEMYCPAFDASENLLGLEIFNGHDRYPSRALWDRLLTHFGGERPIWAFAGDDYHGRARPRGQKRFDRSRMALLVGELSREAVREALAEGRSYVQYNADSHAPFIDAIEETDETITIRASNEQRIEWIGAGERVATGETVARSRISETPYVRAEIHGNGEALTCTQPFYLD